MAADAKWARQRGEAAPDDQARQKAWAAANAYSNTMKAWEERNAAAQGCGCCRWCRSDAPSNCDYR
jgi:hypothetical protein